MHMADALLSPVVGGTMAAASAAAVGYAAHKIKKDELSETKLPVIGVTAAFVFAAQMINFTIPGTGSSGHIGGGMLLAALLGGYPALLGITAVLVIQCLFFADGGLLALGCNIFNMGVIPCLLVYPLLFKPLIRKGLTRGRLIAASLLASVIGLQLGAFAVVLETTVSGITALPFSTFVLLMQPIHLAIGLGEGAATAAILCFVYRMRPELLESADARSAMTVSPKRALAALGVLTVLVGGGLSLAASAYPDGLEWSMEKTAGAAELSADSPAHEAAAALQAKTAVLPDYGFASGEAPVAGTSVSGLVGAGITCVLAGAAGAVILLVKKRKA